MPKNSSAARRDQARALAAAENIKYTEALRRLDGQDGPVSPEKMAATGEPYSMAARAQDAQTTLAVLAPGGIDPVLLAPYPDESGVTTEELGWRVLPADAAPARRAHAEAVWRPVAAARPCRCSGPCEHGAPCGPRDEDDWPCPGRRVHVDRYPGSFFAVAAWHDDYGCDSCDRTFTREVSLPALPWGERSGGQDQSSPRIYDGVRHPLLATSEDADLGCPECGAWPSYLCTCDDDGGCPECGAGGKGDPYGECTCYDDALV